MARIRPITVVGLLIVISAVTASVINSRHPKGEDGETGTSGGHVINTIIPDGGNNHNKGSADGGHHHRVHHNNPNARSKAQKQKQNNIKRFQPMIG